MANFTIHRLANGPDEIGDVGLVAKTATETPQILLTWNALQIEGSAVRIVRNRDHSPAHVDDGVVVYSAARLDSATSFADTLLLHEETYYYSLFILLDGGWYNPTTGSRDYAFSGSKPWLVPIEKTVSSNATPITGTLDAYFTPNDARIECATLAAQAQAGHWVRIGRDVRGVVARVISVDAPYLNVEFHRDEFEHSRDLLPPPITLTDLTITRNNGAYGGLCTISRPDGSFVADKWKVGYPAQLVAAGENKPWKVHTVVNVYASILTFAADRLRDADGKAIRLECPAWRLPGETVYLLKSDGPFLVKRFYEEFLPDNAVTKDAEVGQTYSLQETTLSSGEKVNLESPGEKFGLERFLRGLLMELSKSHAASNYRVKMRDLRQAPVAYVRQFAGNYGYSIPAGIDEDFLARALALVQPHLTTFRGRADNIITWFKILTGQRPTPVFGKDRVVRFNEEDNGFAWDGVCEVLTVPDATHFTIDSAVHGTLPSYLVGGRVILVNDFAAADYTDVGSINAVATDEVTMDSTAALSVADTVILAPPNPVLSGPYAFVHSLYDPEIVDGRGSFFNDRGVAYYLPAAMTDEESDLLRSYLNDCLPMTVSALVYAALELELDLL